MKSDIAIGDRVIVFDSRIYIDDEKTPDCHLPATVISRYRTKYIDNSEIFYDDGFQYGQSTRRYDDLVDVEFDHRPGEISRGHFTSMIKKI